MNAYLLKKLIGKGWIAADADHSAVNLQEVIGSKMASGELDLETYSKWCEEAKAVAAQAKSAADQKVDLLGDTIASKVNAGLSQQFDRLIGALGGKAAAQTATAVADLDDAATKAANRMADTPPLSPTNPADVFKAAGNGLPRVKKATESYVSTKGTLCYREDGKAPWQKAGMPVQLFSGHLNQSMTFDHPSQAEYAKAGALAKFYAKKAGLPLTMSEHEMELVKECLHEDRFVGDPDAGHYGGCRKLTEFEVKTVLDDSTSGGQYAVPEWFDYALITSPLLYGELFPYVNVINVPRGSSADGASFGTPTFVSTAEGSGVSPFTTTSFISNFDTTFYPATCALEMGLDFEADAVPNIGQQIIAKIGMESMRWLDEQIAVGDGTTEPQGIFTATGTSASAENGTTGALTYNDALNMVFAMGKAARVAFGGNRTRYVLNDTQYKKFMQIATGVTGDTRPVFGMNVKAYQLGDYPVSVQQNITSGDMAFCNLGAYRLYRRQGLQFLSDDTGRTNRLAHTRLIVARMRWGGQLELPTTYCVQMLNGSTTA